MKNILALILVCNSCFAQDYFSGKSLNCPSNDAEAMKLFNGGVELLEMNRPINKKYLMLNADIFAKAVLKDTSFCDAYFFAGYTMSLLGDLRATYAFYKVADKKYGKPFLPYKMNIAATCMKLELYQEARQTYDSIAKDFPDSPEGYYGISATSPMLGDYANGLSNLDKAFQLYGSSKQPYGNEVFLLRAVLLTLDKQYEKAIPVFKRIESSYKKDVNFNIYHSLALLKTSQIQNDPKMKDEAFKYYKKIKEKDIIPPDLRKEFVF